MRIRHEGQVIVDIRRTTRPPSGSFEVRRVVRNTPGSDLFSARAVSVRMGEVCRGRVTF